MTLRISTHTMSQQAIDAMLKQQTELSKTQLQISTGKRILTPSDDPTGSVRLLDYNRSIDTLEQYLNNADRASTRLSAEENAITGVENIFQRVRELTVQGSSDLLSQDEKTSIAAEIRQLRDEMLGLGNTRDPQGEYIFAGYQTGSPAFEELGSGTVAYNGDLGNRQLQISADRQIADGDNGYDVFMNVDTSTGKRSLFDTLDQLATDLEANASVTGYLADLDQALSKTEAVRATIGARINAIDEQVQVNQDVKTTLETHRSTEGDLDYTAAIARFNQQTVALEAAQKAYTTVQQLSLFNYL